VAGAAGEVTAAPTLDDDIRAALATGRRVSELATEIAERTGQPRREVYRRALELRRGRDSP